MGGKTINQLSAVDSIADGDLLVVYPANNQDTRKAPASLLKTYLTGALTVSDGKITQYSSPSASPFTVNLTNLATSAWLVITPTGTMAAGTLQLPGVGVAVDNQEVLVNTTQSVTSLTVTATGLNVTGAPSTLAQNGVVRFRFNAFSSTWFKVSP